MSGLQRWAIKKRLNLNAKVLNFKLQFSLLNLYAIFFKEINHARRNYFRY
jgi:hypothetical protein